MNTTNRPMLPKAEREMIRPPRTPSEHAAAAALVSEWAADVSRRAARAIARIASALKRAARRRGSKA